MKMKRKTVFFLICCFSWGMGAAAAAEDFLDLETFSVARGLHYRWDPLTQLASVWNETQVVKFRVGGQFALSQGHLVRLSSKTRLSSGSVQVPFPAKEYLDGLGSLSLHGMIPVPAQINTPIHHQIRRVVIDAGHGGEDTGAVSPYGLKEKRVVLDVARKVKTALESRGLEVVMTRSSDIFIPLADRTQIANKLGADFFVSIHANASLSRSLQGFEIYYLSEATDDVALALERAENSSIRLQSTFHVPSTEFKTIFWDLHESENRKESLRIARHVSVAVSSSVSVAAQRLRSANFYVLKWTECPAILIETGYLTNKQDERRLRDPLYKTALAQAIADGIWHYKTEYEATDGFTQ